MDTNWKLLRFIDDNKLLTFKDIVDGFIHNEITLKPALNIELKKYEYLRLIKRHRGRVPDFDGIHITAKGMTLCRLLKARDRLDAKIMEHLNK